MQLTKVTLLFEELKLVLFVRAHDNILIPTPGTQNLTIGWQVICDTYISITCALICLKCSHHITIDARL